jgi:hypothetical protein
MSDDWLEKLMLLSRSHRPQLWLSYSFAASELEHWSNLATGHEVAAETGELKKATQQIVEAARILSSTRKSEG